MGRISRSSKQQLSEEERRAQLGLADWPVPETEQGSDVRVYAERPIWTEHKAKLIERYLYYFVLVTHHGTYIDGFAGPQEADKPEMWSAKLVLESEPRWLRRFYLCDLKRSNVEALEALWAAQPARKKGEPKRTVVIQRGDFNRVAEEFLGGDNVPAKEAAFCLLDQRTFECEWATVRRLARHKSPVKIELFYFLPAHWFGRAFSETEDRSVIQKWWGRDDWEALGAMTDRGRADLFCDRFKKELGYRYSYAWPIYSLERGEGRIKYYMVHATDHSEAPKLMRRAYEQALQIGKPPEQFDWVGGPSGSRRAKRSHGRSSRKQ